MKIKSLLVAGLAVLAVSAFAEDKTCTSTLSMPDGYTIAAGEEDASWQAITLNRVDDATDFTNMEFQLSFPEGLGMLQTGVDDEGNPKYALAANSGTSYFDEDQEMTVQPLGWAGGYIEGGNFRCIAANVSKTKITANPVGLCRVKFKADDTFKGGTIKVVNLKYTDYADNNYVNAESDLIEFPTSGPEDAVANINAGKAVAGVKYYNVAGQAADSAFEGVNIVVTTYADGTQNVVKVVK